MNNSDFRSETDALLKGIILRGIGGFYYVETAKGIIECKPRGIFRKNKLKPVAGDVCYISLENAQNQNGTIEKIEERKNFLLRPPVANVDCIYFVVSIKEPAPNLTILDRLIAIAEFKDIEPVIVITKNDLSDDNDVADEIYGIYSRAGFDVYVIDYDNLSSVNALKSSMAGKLSIFCGNSGVGKSTLLNAIDHRLDITTSEISQKLGRGRHTTRDVFLYPLDAGGYIADTPGFSTIEVGRFDVILKDQVQYCFREFDKYLGKCQFIDCLHTVEKGCAILNALEKGEISYERHKNYVAMVEEAKKINEWEL